MANSENRNPNPDSLINKIIVGAALAFLAGGTLPWWYEPVKDALDGSNKTKAQPEQTLTSDDDQKSGGQSSRYENTNAPAKKLEVSSVKVNEENDSGSYPIEHVKDSNNQSYWSSKPGLTLDVVIDFSFDEPVSLSQINIYSPYHTGGDTQPKKVEFIFLNKSKEKITSYETEFRDSADKWQEYKEHKFERVNNVSSVKMMLGEPHEQTASFIKIHEIRFYGYE